MTTEKQETAHIYLRPANLTLTECPALVSTVLGSCVAVTLFCPALGMGGICHAMLPSGSSNEPFKFVDGSLGYMLQWFAEKGVSHGDLEAKLFGGSDMFSGGDLLKRLTRVGQQNVEMALHLISDAGIRLVAQDVGGRGGRKILFRSHTGEVFLKRLENRDCSKRQE